MFQNYSKMEMLNVLSLLNCLSFLSLLFTDIRRSEELSLLKPPDDHKKKKKKKEKGVDEILNMDITGGMAGGIYALFVFGAASDDIALFG